MSDLIDRAQAQTELQFSARRYTVAHEANGEGRVVWSDNLISVTDAIDALRKVPSAQLGTDCISRRAAINALAEDMPSAYTPDGSHPADEGIFMAQEIYADCIQALKDLPSAQPEPKRGKWIDTGSNEEWYAREYRCSECGDTMLGEANFCPTCGSRNEVTE